jgi:hypothetical protein
MRRASTPLPPLMILPLAFWACGGDARSGDAGPRADAGVRDAAAADASGADAGAEDASALDASDLAPDSGALDAGPPPCRYPEGATEPMALDAVISAYRWGRALDGAGNAAALDLTRAFCDDDPLIDWAPFDALLFISAPAW